MHQSYGVFAAGRLVLLCFGFAAISLSANSRHQLEEITVTAEKRNASLQDISQSVTVLTDFDLDRYSIHSLVDLNGLVPGLNTVKNEGTMLVLSMRGIGNEANQNVIAAPAVSYHIDGVYMASPQAMQAKLLDIERIEVIRGPQGTVFGQNSTGGAINIVTARPSFNKRTGSFSIELGNYESLRTQGVANVPLSSTAALRMSFATDYHEGFSRNVLLNQALDDDRNIAAHLRMYIEPSHDISLDFTAQTAKNHRNGPAQKGILDSILDPRELAQDYPQLWNLDASFTSASVKMQRDTVTIRSISSLQQDTLLVHRDNDRHALGMLPRFRILPAKYEPWFNELRTLTQELQFTSATRLFNRIDWIVGFFYFQSDVFVKLREYIDFGADGVFDPISVEEIQAFELGDYGFITESDRKRRASSVYFQDTYHANDRTRLIGGLRLSQDNVSSAISNFYGRGGLDTQSTSSQTLTGRFSFERDLSNDSMLYVSLVRGYKPGGSNLTFGREHEIAPIIVQPTFKKETVNTIELGLKADYFARQLRMNAAIFHYNYRNLQYQATDPEVFEGGVNNIPTSSIVGSELEAFALLSGTLSMDLRIGILNTKITSHHLSLDNVASDATTNALLSQGFDLFGPEIQRSRAEQIVDVFGNKLAKSPRSILGFAINYERDLASLGRLQGSVQINRRGGYQYRIFNNPSTDFVPGYTVMNALVRFEPFNVRWHATLRILNATDKDGVNARFTDVFGVGASSEELISPRRVLVGWNLTF